MDGSQRVLAAEDRKPRPTLTSGSRNLGKRSPRRTAMPSNSLPVVVDLDGTLSKSDTLHEQMLVALLHHPWRLIGALFALRNSKQAFKSRLEQIVFGKEIHPIWNADVLEKIFSGPAPEVVVCTASNQDSATRLTKDLKVSAVFGSTGTTNLKAENKANFLQSRYGERGFIYFGNDAPDLPVWKVAAKAVVVSDDASLAQSARGVCPEVEVIPANKGSLVGNILKELRPHQWTKNFLIFVPMIASHRFAERPLLVASCAAFVIFCLLSSAVYVLNDLLDLSADRQHAAKRRRPFAAGNLSVLFGPPLFLGLSAAGLTGAAFLGKSFLFACVGYLFITALYSAVLKKLALIDVYTLAGLYTLRLVAGGAATGIPISVWLAAFSIFIFLSIALCKRYTELLELPSETKIKRRGYFASDAPFVFGQGLIFMGCATLVLAVYLSSAAVVSLYKTPSILWLAVLIISFWGSRTWLLATRRQMHEDPVLFALKDRISWLCLLVLAAVFFSAMQIG